MNLMNGKNHLWNYLFMNLEDTLLYVEILLMNDFNPVFTDVQIQNGFIYVFMACNQFKHYSISERIESIFSLLKMDCPDILLKFPVIVEAFDSDELQELMRNAKQTLIR